MCIQWRRAQWCLGVAEPTLPWASQRSVAVSPSTTSISGSGTEGLGTEVAWKPPWTTTSTLVSVVPSLLRAVHTYVPPSSGRAARICTGKRRWLECTGLNRRKKTKNTHTRTQWSRRQIPAWLRWTPWARGCSAWSCGCCPVCARTPTAEALLKPDTPGWWARQLWHARVRPVSQRPREFL